MGFNWVDIVMAVIILKGMHSVQKSIFVTEVYHFVGAALATFITLHYYVGFGHYLHKSFSVPESVQSFTAFCLLGGGIIFFFFVSQGGWKALLSVTMPNFLEHWGCLVLAALRNFMYAGLAFLALTMFDNGLFARETQGSFGSRIFQNMSIATYSFMHQNIVQPLFKHERFNDQVYHIIAPPRKTPVAVKKEE